MKMHEGEHLADDLTRRVGVGEDVERVRRRPVVHDRDRQIGGECPGGEAIEPSYEHVTTRPSGEMELWRGARLASNGRGMSWSVHRDVAKSFAERENLGQDAGVWGGMSEEERRAVKRRGGLRVRAHSVCPRPRRDAPGVHPPGM